MSFATDGHKADFDALLHCRGDAPEHGQGVALVVCVLQPANYRGSRPHQLGKLALRQAALGAKSVDLACNVVIGARFFKLGDSLRPAFVVPAMKNLDRVCRGLSLLRHVTPPQRYAGRGLRQTASSGLVPSRSPWAS